METEPPINWQVNKKNFLFSVPEGRLKHPQMPPKNRNAKTKITSIGVSL